MERDRGRGAAAAELASAARGAGRKPGRHERLVLLREAMNEAVTGQERLVERLIIAAITGSHILLEGPPGVAKTLAVVTMADRLFGSDGGGAIRQADGSMVPVRRRVQFIPDLMPSDLLGGIRAVPRKDGSGVDFVPVMGPVRCYLFIADEINRAMPKVQAALLEVMQERKITKIDGEGSVRINDSGVFTVVATMNPLENEGTFPMTEAALDRFQMKVSVDIPEEDVMVDIASILLGRPESRPEPKGLFGTDDFVELIREVRAVRVPPYLRKYAARIVAALRRRPDPARQGYGELSRSIIYDYLAAPCSPRALNALLTAAQGLAYLGGRTAVTASDIQEIAPEALSHRIVLNFEAQTRKAGSGIPLEQYIVEELLRNIEIPRFTAERERP